MIRRSRSRLNTALMHGWTPRHVGHTGLSSRDLIAVFAKHPEHEDGESPKGVTRSWCGVHDDMDLPVPLLPSWHRKAECAKPEYAGCDFFHIRKGNGPERRACAACPVRLDCLEDALSHECESRICFGLFGGMTAGERLALIREGETRGLVYFGWGNGLVKIGTTRGSIAERARTHGITILATEPGSYTREHQLHKEFAEDNAHGEWFHPSERLLAYIAALPDQVGTAVEAQTRAAAA